MTNICKYLIAMTFFVYVGTANAAGTGSGEITALYTSARGSVIVETKNYTGRPSCASTRQFAFDGSTSGGKNMLANLMLAKSNDLGVVIRGYGSCDAVGNREDVKSLYVR